LLDLARRYHYLSTAIVFDLPEEVCQANNARRAERTVPERVITTHTQLLRRTHAMLQREGFHLIYTLRSPEEVASAVIERVPLRNDLRGEHGPFDIIGDVHGCFDELTELLERLGYRLAHQPDANGCLELVALPPAGRTAIFVGDLGDRGPAT